MTDWRGWSALVLGILLWPVGRIVVRRGEPGADCRTREGGHIPPTEDLILAACAVLVWASIVASLFYLLTGS